MAWNWKLIIVYEVQNKSILIESSILASMDFIPAFVLDWPKVER